MVRLTYTIKRWDVMLFQNSITKTPVVYIEPDKKFLKYISKNNGVLCTISGTDMAYDQNSTVGFIRQSSTTPSPRQNFYNETGYYTIILTLPWLGYPNENKLGMINFDVIDEESKNNTLLPLQPSQGEQLGINTKAKSIDMVKFLIAIAILIAIIILCVMII
jgi:hypothetical protein